MKQSLDLLFFKFRLLVGLSFSNPVSNVVVPSCDHVNEIIGVEFAFLC